MRKLFLTMVVLALACSMFMFVGCGDSEDTSGKLTMAKYEQIETGMTYDQVREIIGSDGELSVESGEKGTEYYTVVYTWKESNASGSIGANASFTFQGENVELKTKAQAGLK